MTITVHHGDMREVLKRLAGDGALFDSAVTDPPYHLTSIVKRFGSATAAPAKAKQTGAFTRASRGFMGKQWDGGDIAFDPATWRLVFDVLKPCASLLAFSGDRTYHRMACAIEDAGFVIVRMHAWLYGSGFPKSHDFGTSFDKALLGIDRDEDPTDWEASRSHFATYWDGWGSDVKPALEPVCRAIKPMQGTIAANVAAHGVGGVNIDGCRIDSGESTKRVKRGGGNQFPHEDDAWQPKTVTVGSDLGRFPANVMHDGSDEVLAGFPAAGGMQRPVTGAERAHRTAHAYGVFNGTREGAEPRGDSGSAARFFYCAKADAGDRLDSKHPTVKPVDVKRWLIRLVTPPGGHVLDPFAGSGTTGMACLAEGMRATLIEREAEYVADIRRRLAHVTGADTPLFGGVGE